MGIQKNNFNMDNLNSLIECPVTLETFKNPVSLNCAHKIEEHIAKELLAKEGKCPTCQEKITVYKKDPQFNETIKAIVDLKAEVDRLQQKVNQLEKNGVKQLDRPHSDEELERPVKRPKISLAALTQQSEPNIKATFTYENGVNIENKNFIIFFKSSTKDSTIKKFNFSISEKGIETLGIFKTIKKGPISQELIFKISKEGTHVVDISNEQSEYFESSIFEDEYYSIMTQNEFRDKFYVEFFNEIMARKGLNQDNLRKLRSICK